MLGATGMIVPLGAQTIIVDGRSLPTDRQASAILDQAESCGLDPGQGRFRVTEEKYSIEPGDDAGRKALDAQVDQLLGQSGFGSDPDRNQVSRQFIRNLLVNRVLLTLEMNGLAGGRALDCLTNWLSAHGFKRVSAGEADAIRSRWNKGS